MNPFRLALTLLGLFAALGLQAQPADKSAALPPYRFLILVDASSNMRRLDNITATVVYDLIYDGVLGRMQTGDVYGVWTFNDTVDTEFYPPMIWDKNSQRTQAQSVDAQLRKLKYQGKPRLEEAIRQVNNVVQRSDELTVIIVHDGSGVMFGTPFDLPITTLYRQFQKDMVKSERPFLTSFIVRDKQMAAWSVDAAGGSIGIPFFPRKALTTQATPTNAVKKAAKPVEPEPQPEPKKAPPASIIVKGPIKPPTAATNAPATATTPKPAPKPPEVPKPELTTKSAPATVAPKLMPKPELTPTAQTESKPFQPVMDNAAPKPLPTSPAQNSSTPIPSPAPKPALTAPALQLTPPAASNPVNPGDIPPVKAPPAVEVVSETASKPAPSPATPAKPAPVAPTAPTPPSTPTATAAAKAVDAAAQLAQTAVVTPAPGPDWLKISFGILCLGGAIGIALMMTRKSRSPAHGSVISRSMDNDRRQ